MAGIKDVSANVAEALNCPKVVAEDAVKAVFTAIDEITSAGDSVIIKGFGTFKIKEFVARECRNPQTGEPVHVPAKEKLTFKASK